MKYFKILISLLLICILFSGCAFKIASSIDDLISPVSPFGDNADIKEALDEYAKGGYSLKTPNAGKYITSYSFFDLDGDKSDEAVTFYEPNDDLGSINMAVIKKDGREWSVIENIKGEGTDIHSIEFADLTHNGKNELIVCWDVISNSTSHELNVYSFNPDNEKKKLKKIGVSVSVNNYLAVDLLGDKENQLLMLEFDNGNSSARAELYSYDGGDQQLLGETKLDAHITGYETIQTERLDGNIRVYADALGSDGASMLTELIYWSDNYGTIVSPFYSYDTGLTSDTTRTNLLNCLDIDSNGRLDIPTDYDGLGKLPKKVKAVDWRVYKNTALLHTAYSLFAENESYTVIIPDEMVDSIKVSYNDKTGEMSVINRKTEKVIFTVMSVLKATYTEDKYPGFVYVTEGGGYGFLAKQGNDEEYKISLTDIESYIKPI